MIDTDKWLARHSKPLVTKKAMFGFGAFGIVILALNLALLGAAVWIVVMVLRWTGVLS